MTGAMMLKDEVNVFLETVSSCRLVLVVSVLLIDDVKDGVRECSMDNVSLAVNVRVGDKLCEWVLVREDSSEPLVVAVGVVLDGVLGKNAPTTEIKRKAANTLNTR